MAHLGAFVPRDASGDHGYAAVLSLGAQPFWMGAKLKK
jgi:hypothetical protein